MPAPVRRNWATGLPPELLRKIAGDVKDVFDYASFRRVCKGWRAAAAPADLPPQLPVILLDPRNRASKKRRFVFLRRTSGGLIEPRYLTLSFRSFSLTTIYGSSAHGWLLLLKHGRPAATLLNPITGARHQLPSLVSEDTDRAQIVSRSSTDCMVMLQSPSLVTEDTDPAKKLAFCRLQEQAWRILPSPSCLDFTYHKGRFFFLLEGALTDVYDADTLERVAEIPSPPLSMEDPAQDRWVESPSGELLLVVFRVTTYHFVDEGAAGAEMFEVFRLDESGELRWLRVRDISDTMLFVNHYSALSLPSTGFCGFKGSCIYFIKCRDLEDVSAVMAFDMKDGSITEVTSLFGDSVKGRTHYHFIWMVPTLG